MTVWQDGGTSLLEATARKQGESDGEQEGALSDGSLLASSTDQVTTALHKTGSLSAVVAGWKALDCRQYWMPACNVHCAVLHAESCISCDDLSGA